jgi:hypothetical protein
MFEKIRLSAEKLARKGNLAKIGVVGALVLAGCGEASEPEQQAVQAEDPAAESLNQYRDRVNFNKKAHVVLNTCVAWGNVSGGITVTQNPGVDTVRSGGDTYSYFVFSYPDSDKKFPLLQQMNGPQAKVTENGAVYGGGPSGSLLTIDLEKQKGYLAHATNRKLSDKPTFANNDQIYFEDAQTGQPVMNTVITDGPFTDKRVNAVCDALRQHAPVDPFN